MEINSQRRGVVLFLAVIVVAMLSLGGLIISRMMTREYQRAVRRGDSIQSAVLVQSGVETIIAALSNNTTNSNLTYNNATYNNASVFAGVAVAPPVLGQTPRGMGRFTVLAPMIASERLVGVRYGLVNESAKLSLTTVLRWEEATPGTGVAALMKLPGMTLRFAESLLDWLDADKSPQSNGAELDEYAAMGLSYAPRNDVPVSLDELLLIYGADRERLFGNDPEWCYGYRRNGAWVSVAETLPLAMLLTVCSAEKLLTPAGEAKLFLNDVKLDFLESQLRRVLDRDSVDFIVAYRRANGDAIHPLDLLDAPASPFSLDKGEGERRFFALLDEVTESPSVTVRGRVNVMEAPACILATLPGLTAEQVAEIVARRGEVGATRDPSQRHAVWLLARGIVDAATMQQLWDDVTCGGDVYSAQVIGFFDNDATSSRAEVVVDSTVRPPRVVFQKEMSGVPHAYPRRLLMNSHEQ